MSAVMAKKKDRLVGGERLRPGEMLTSPNSKYTLVFQSDANLVLYEGGLSKWSCGVDVLNPGDSWVQLEKEGNLVRYVERNPQWSSGSRFRRTPGDAILILQDDGILVLKLDGVVVWGINGAVTQQYAPHDFDAITSGNIIRPGQYLVVGQGITSKNGHFFAFLQENGQFVVRHNATKTILYNSPKVPSKAPSRLTVGYTDDIIVWATDGTKIWEASKVDDDVFSISSTEEDEESFLSRLTPGVVLDSKGNLLRIGSTWPNDPVWSSDSGFSGFAKSVSELKVGEALPLGQKLRSRNGDHELSLLPSGYLQLRNTVLNENKFYSFQPNTVITDATYLVFGRDLVLDLRGADGRSIWRAENSTPDWKDRRPNFRDPDGRSIWRTSDGDREKRQFKYPTSFILSNSGRVVVTEKGEVLWSTEKLTMKKSLT